MKTTLTAIVILAAIFLIGSFALGQMLPPKHPGYPMDKAVSPVTGQPLANDPGEANVFGEKALTEAGVFHDKESVQELSISPPTDQRLLGKTPGQLPKVEGPEIKIEPPVKEATRMPQ